VHTEDDGGAAEPYEVEASNRFCISEKHAAPTRLVRAMSFLVPDSVPAMGIGGDLRSSVMAFHGTTAALSNRRSAGASYE